MLGICLIYCIGELCLAGQLSNILFTLCFASLVDSPQFKDSYKVRATNFSEDFSVVTM